MSGAVLTIDLGVLGANWRALAKRAAPAELGAVVKADAYGLGLDLVAPALRRLGARHFFVAQTNEGVALRRLVPDPAARIHVLNGVAPDEAGTFRAHDLNPVLNDPDQVRLWRGLGADGSPPPPASLQIDTGMNRLGIEPRDLAALMPLGDLRLDLVMSHLACAETPDDPLNDQQARVFVETTAPLSAIPRSLANSAALLNRPDLRFDLVRAGLALHGAEPALAPECAPVARLTAPVIQVRRVDLGEPVGYGASHVAARPSRIATLAVGYADGYARALGNRARVWIEAAEAFAPVVGRVSMDLVTVDVTDIPDHRVGLGARAELFGARVPVGDLATLAGTLSYEILTGIGGRVARVAVGEVG